MRQLWTRNDIERWATAALIAFREYRQIPGYSDDRAQHIALLDMSEILADIETETDNSNESGTTGTAQENADMFACEIKKTKRCHMECTERVVGECQFELTGPKTGQTCGRTVCSRHSKFSVVSGKKKRWCLAHIRVVARAKSTE